MSSIPYVPGFSNSELYILLCLKQGTSHCQLKNNKWFWVKFPHSWTVYTSPTVSLRKLSLTVGVSMLKGWLDKSRCCFWPSLAIICLHLACLSAVPGIIGFSPGTVLSVWMDREGSEVAGSVNIHWQKGGECTVGNPWGLLEARSCPHHSSLNGVCRKHWHPLLGSCTLTWPEIQRNQMGIFNGRWRKMESVLSMRHNNRAAITQRSGSCVLCRPSDPSVPLHLPNPTHFRLVASLTIILTPSHRQGKPRYSIAKPCSPPWGIRPS